MPVPNVSSWGWELALETGHGSGSGIIFIFPYISTLKSLDLPGGEIGFFLCLYFSSCFCPSSKKYQFRSERMELVRTKVCQESQPCEKVQFH